MSLQSQRFSKQLHRAYCTNLTETCTHCSSVSLDENCTQTYAIYSIYEANMLLLA